MGVPSPLPRTQSPSSRVTKAAPRRAGRGRRGGLVTQDLGCVQKQRGRLRRALSEPSVPAARPLGVTRRPAILELAGRSAPFRPPSPRLLSPLAARPLLRALQALAGPLLSPPARGSAELVARLCPRHRPPSPPHTHTHTLVSPTPHPSPPAAPRTLENTAERTAPTTATAARRSPPARATSSGRLATFPNSTTAARRRCRHCSSLRAFHPPQTPETNRGAKKSSFPSPMPPPRSPTPPPTPGTSWLARGNSPPPGGKERGGGDSRISSPPPPPHPPHPFPLALALSPPSHPGLCCPHPHPHPGVATAGPRTGLEGCPGSSGAQTRS
ncbi:uncharacterized protein LOC121816976 [Ovis aries]|uniref:uncharacterized protein LOC121816976 n=1 Tax=Ovis aries TaxID=9940 RepID=UPI002952699A|nr:uncharacterized protein LOC121816976 [Ovis aries]